MYSASPNVMENAAARHELTLSRHDSLPFSRLAKPTISRPQSGHIACLSADAEHPAGTYRVGKANISRREAAYWAPLK